jgi:hypothetical protein
MGHACTFDFPILPCFLSVYLNFTLLDSPRLLLLPHATDLRRQSNQKEEISRSSRVEELEATVAALQTINGSLLVQLASSEQLLTLVMPTYQSPAVLLTPAVDSFVSE